VKGLNDGGQSKDSKMKNRQLVEIELAPDERRFLDLARLFAQQHISPHAADWERKRIVPRDLFPLAAELGLTGLLVPKDLGGQGISHVATARILEEIAGHCMAFAFSLVVHNNLAGNIARNGSRDLIDRYLPEMISGDRVGAFCLTEPSAGSDAAAITTSATRDDRGWVIDGQKAWVTNGAMADVISVYAQTDAKKGWRGIACFLVDAATRGLTKEQPYALFGGHAMGTNGLSLKRCHVPSGNMLLGPGDGFKAAMVGINIARVYVGAMCCGMMQSSLGCALDYAVKRKAFGKATAEFQGLQWKLADVATDLEAARLLTYRAATMMDAGSTAMVEAAHAKKFASVAALQGIAECMQAMGAAGYRSDNPLGRHLANAKMAQYLDGTTEIQNVVITRSLINRRCSPVKIAS
jgi:alkylation response protein AidB-like acyl-CoA dehydrogenase